MTRISLLLLALGLAAAPAMGAERLPNVVLFLVDDLGWRDLGCYGSRFYETPHGVRSGCGGDLRGVS
jgi:hypothetical protein